jgi:squalene synthase HpnC
VTGAGLGGTAGSGLDHQGAPAPGGAAAPAGTKAGEAPATADGIAVTGEISLAVAAKASGENFPVALRMLPRSVRAHLTAFYGFARLVDDIGDEPLPALAGQLSPGGATPRTPRIAPGGAAKTPDTLTAEEERAIRLRLLDELEADVAKIYDGGEPDLPAMRVLGETIRACGIPFQPFRDLVQANRQDQQVTRYATYEELVQYCELSANPVGAVVLYIFGAATQERLALSDKICTALQLVEHWQDVAEDLANGRVYLPQDDLRAHGVTEEDLARPTASVDVVRLMGFETDRATRLLDEGAPLAGTLGGWARLAISGYIAGGRAAIAAIVNSGYDVLRKTPRPGKAATVAGLVSCYVKGR